MSEYQPHYTESNALIIGIGDYTDLPALPGAIRDAEEMARVLSSDQYGFNVTLLLNEQATRMGILSALNNLQRVAPDSRNIVYFAGHGENQKDRFGHERGVIFCYDSKLDNMYTWLEHTEMTKIRGFTEGKHLLFIFDSCFSGKALGLTSLRSTGSRYMERAAYQVLTGGADEVVADETSMTRMLIPLLENPTTSAALRLENLFPRLQDAMERARCVQIPQQGHLQGSAGGDFVFYQPPVSPFDGLPDRLRRALTSGDDDTRFYALDRAERLINRREYLNELQTALREMALHDPDTEVRQRAMEVWAKATVPPPQAPERIDPEPAPAEVEIVEWEPEPEPEPEPQYDPIYDILPQPFDWCEIPSGRITLDGNEGTYDVEPFMMAKYPITYEQFQMFIDANDGFYNDEWWQGLAKQESKVGNQNFKGQANLPRENVSWYDAIAFCRWLSSRVGYEVRLPTEWEWQWAAQGPDGKEYPWGDEYIQGYANIDEKASNINGGVYLEKTTPVGSYPKGASPYGVLDLSGNVWEWCLNEYDNPSRTDTSGDARRVVRGGSWPSSHHFARAVYRGFGGLNLRRFSGFRVVGFPLVLA